MATKKKTGPKALTSARASKTTSPASSAKPGKNTKSAKQVKAAKQPIAERSSAPLTAKSQVANLTPLTLDEARALIAPKQRARGATAESSATAELSPAPVGKARQTFEAQHDEVVARETAEYTQLITLLTERGAKAPPAPVGRGAKRVTTESAESFTPLKVFAEGDSWFSYPLHADGGIIRRLSRRLGVPILNLAHAGDEVRYMLGVKQRERLVQVLKDGSPAGGAWELILFSGGGNDIVGDPMALWVKDWDESVNPAALLHTKRFDAAVDLVLAGYEDLLALRNALSPGTHVILHAYDFAIPDGRGACYLGPWLNPTFDARGFPKPLPARTAVVEAMLRRFADRLSAFEKKNNKVSFLNTQGTLPRNTSSWHNELHPSDEGFDTFAGLFHEKIKALFPTRVA